jgi:hypothetical protein
MTRMTEQEFAEFLRLTPGASFIDYSKPSPEPMRWTPEENMLVLKQPAKPAKAPAPTEHDEQVALFAWATEQAAHWPELAFMYAVPNGGYRHPATAAMLKAEGVKAGVPDIFLPTPRHHWHGLYIEMKRADRSNHPTTEQSIWIETLRQQGYVVAVCYGCDAAIAAIESYYMEGQDR